MAKTASLIISVFICASAFVAVHGDKFDWIPANIPTPSEQCMRHEKHFPGNCEIPIIEKAKECHLPCANNKAPSRQYGVFFIPATDGTICGSSHVCRRQKCVKIPANKVPKETGVKKIYDCDWKFQTRT